jgi:hypothetical protein
LLSHYAIERIGLTCHIFRVVTCVACPLLLLPLVTPVLTLDVVTPVLALDMVTSPPSDQ